MERKRQREIALGAIAVVLIGAAALRSRSTVSGSSPATATPTPITAASGRPPAAVQASQVADVDLQALAGKRPEPVPATRNPFRFKPRAAPPPPTPAPTAVRPATPVNAGPAEPAAPPRIPLKFIGVLDSPETGRVAVLSDPRGVYQGRVGETIDGHYRILNIGVESIELAYVDGRGRQTIRLTGQ